MQTKTQSFLEAIANIIIGIGISLAFQIWIFSYYGVQCSMTNNIKITLWFTLVSLCRSYVLRRLFNKISG
jgi:hypothetical protein